MNLGHIEYKIKKNQIKNVDPNENYEESDDKYEILRILVLENPKIKLLKEQYDNLKEYIKKQYDEELIIIINKN